MATDLTTVFVPLISEANMGGYAPGDFAVTTRPSDLGVTVAFVPMLPEDASVYLIAPSEVFFVPAGSTVTPTNGPTVSADHGQNIVLIHIWSTFEWAPILAPTGQPVAEWWALEGISTGSFEDFVDGHDLETLAGPRGFSNGADLRQAVMTGAASLNALMLDEQPVVVGLLENAVAGVLSLGVRTWASLAGDIVEVDAGGALTAMLQLAPSLSAHPLLASVLGDVRTRDVTVYVRFVYWEPNGINAINETDKGDFIPVPKDSRISLQKRSPGPVYTLIVEAPVTEDDSGQVALVVPRAQLDVINLAAGESLVFRLDVPPGTKFTPQYQHDRQPIDARQSLTWGVFSDAWLTEGRATTDDAILNLDVLVNYSGAQVGSAQQPIEYYVGIPVFLQIQYPVVYVTGADPQARFATLTRSAPKGLLVDVRDSTGFVCGRFRTDEHGQIWGALYNGGDSLPVPLEIVVHHELEDGSIDLLPVSGDVVRGGNPPETSYSSNSLPANAARLALPLINSLGKRTEGDKATGLLTIDVGEVTIPAKKISRFESVDGHHAGLLHALQQVRYIHQWFDSLTQGFTLAGRPESWTDILARHDGTAGVWPHGPAADRAFTIALPILRVTDPLPGAEGITGAADVFVVPPGTPPVTRTWCLTLYGYDSFAMNQKLEGQPIKLDNRTQFWRGHTIWHEWTHAVINMVLERMLDLDVHTLVTLSKDGSTSGRISGVIFDSPPPPNNGGIPLSGGWSTLEEALAAVPEVALLQKATGTEPVFTPTAVAHPRHIVVDLNAAGVADGIPNPKKDLTLANGMNIDLNTNMGPPVQNDERLGLRVPIAFTWALWTALVEAGGFNQTLEAHVTGTQVVNDLRDVVPYLNDPTAQRIFQSLFWGPLVAARTADVPGSQWNDMTGLVFGPTTYRFMQDIQNQFWGALTPVEQDTIKDLFGDADNPLSFYLWFSFP